MQVEYGILSSEKLDITSSFGDVVMTVLRRLGTCGGT